MSASSSGFGSFSFGDLKCEREKVKLALHRLALKKVLGGMCDVNGFRSQWEVAIYNARSKLLALGHKLSPQLAIESDPSKCKELIDNAMREALADLAVSGGQE